MPQQIQQDELAIGYYTFIFVSFQTSNSIHPHKFPQLEFNYNINKDLCIIKLAEIYFNQLKEQQIISHTANFSVDYVALSTFKFQHTNYDFDDQDQDQEMRINDWLIANLQDSRSNIYVYIQLAKSGIQSCNIGNRKSDDQRHSSNIELAIYLPNEQHRVVYVKTKKNGIVRQCLERHFPEIQNNLNIKMRNVEDYYVSVKKIYFNILLKLHTKLNKFSKQIKKILVVQKSVIELIHKDSQVKIKKYFFLNFTCRQKNFEPFSINYYQYQHFKCFSLCQMAGLAYVESFAILIKGVTIKSNDPLTTMQSLINESLRLGISQLDCRFIDQQEFYYESLSNMPDLLDVDSQLLKDSLNFTFNSQIVMKTIKHHSNSLMKKMTIQDEVHNYLPHLVKNQSYFSVFTAYTLASGNIYNPLNSHHRRQPITASVEGNPCLLFSYVFTKRLQYLPYGNPNEIYFRGVKKIRQDYEKGSVIFYRQVISASKSSEKALQFIGKVQQKYIGTFAKIHALAIRCIDPFSQFYDLNRSQYENVFSPYTPFHVLSAAKENDVFTLELQELPLIKNYHHKHIIWIGSQLQTISNFYNRLRYEPNQKATNQAYLEIDLLQYKDNATFMLCLQNFGEIKLKRQQMIVIFTLEGNDSDKLERIRLIHQHIKAKAYLCFNSPVFNQQTMTNPQLNNMRPFLDRIIYVHGEHNLRKQVVNAQGFDLACCSSCNLI